MVDRTNILFVCLGNIVRSPLAENIFRRLVDQAGLAEKYFVDSAGTGAWHIGEQPDPRMVCVAAGYGLNYTGKARQISRKDFREFDWLIAMDRDNRAYLYSMAHGTEEQAKIRMLREFDPQARSYAPVPDPYYGGIDGFEETYHIVERSCKRLFDALERGELVKG